MRRYDHIDLRVRGLDEARRFYETLLPELGFRNEVRIEGSLQYEAPGVNGVAEFFGVKESPEHAANECRIAFWAESPAEVDRLATFLPEAGARHIDGPAFEEPHTMPSSLKTHQGTALRSAIEPTVLELLLTLWKSR